MTVFVDNANIPFAGMKMSHMWADTLPELLAMADRIGVHRRWLQEPPKASWTHFDISLGKKARAIAAGAVLTDLYAALEHVARQQCDFAMLDRIAALRARKVAANVEP